MTIYHLTGHLRGTTLREAWINHGVLCGKHPQNLREDEANSIVEISGYIYPGLLDAHTHIGTNHGVSAPSDAEMLRRLQACAAHGVTAIRDAGGQRNPNEVTGFGLPKVVHCGQHIARFKRYTRYLAVEVEPAEFVEQCCIEAEKSDGWIKIIGDWIDREKGDLAPLWEAGILTQAVSAVHQMGVKVAVHTFAAETVPMLLAAGVDGIEHGTGMSAAQIVVARDAGILLTPTVNQISRFPEFAANGYRFPRYQQRMFAMDAHRHEHLQMFVDAGISLLMGSDTAEDVAERGLWVELQDAVKNGIPADLVMASASYRGRESLGFGTWNEGDAADFVVYQRDPEQDISTVANPEYVFIDGVLI